MEGLEALDLLPEAVLVLGPDGIVQHANDRAASVLGTPDDVVGQRFADVVTLLTGDGVVCADPVPERGPSQRIAERDWLVRLPDGRERPVAMTGRFLAGGRVALSFRSAARRRRDAAAQGDLVARVSHDVRAPVATLRGFAQPLLHRWDELGDDLKRTMVEAIDRDAARVSEMLDELLTAARLDAGHLRLRTDVVDLGALAGEVVAGARVRPHGRGRDVDVAVDARAPVRVLADPGQVERILTNLVDNALVHAPDAVVRVEVERAGDDRVAVTVVDDGPGIARAHREQVFARFGRGPGTTGPGTGLGLHIARSLARAHDGDLTLASGPDGGCRFRLELPAAD